jgi:hypothetical protein
LRELFLRAARLRRRRARDLERALGEGPELVEGPAAVVVLADVVRRVEVLDRREARDLEPRAQRFARRGAVDVRDEHGLRPLVVLR